MTTALLSRNDVRPSRRTDLLAPRWVETDAQARQAARSSDANAVWIVGSTRLANRMVKEISWPIGRAGFLVLIGTPRPGVLPALERRFERVIFVEKRDGFLPKQELSAVLKTADRRDRFIGGMVDKDAQIVTLWRGDLTSLIVPFSAFPAAGNGTAPDWDRFKVADYGYTIGFGPYEAAWDSVLYEYDADFRRRLKKTWVASEQTLGASIRRLRMTRRLTRQEVGSVDPKTLARIERGEVSEPRADTLAVIARRLGVAPEELGSY